MRRDLLTIVQLGAAFALIFSAFNSQGLIEISVLRAVAQSPSPGGITESSGYYSLSIIYFVFTFSNLLVPALVKKIGSKWSQVVGASCYLFFLLAFEHLNAAFLYGTSALLGFGAALLWTGNGAYLIEFSRNGKVERNTGIMWALLQSSLIIGAGFLIFVLRNGDLASSYQMVYMVFAGVSFAGVLVLSALPSYPPAYEQDGDDDESRERLVPEAGEDSANEADPSTEGTSMSSFKKTFELLQRPHILILGVTFMFTGIEMTFYSGVYTACISATTAMKAYSDLVIPYNALAIGGGQILGGLIPGAGSRFLKLTRSQVVLLGMTCHAVAYFLCFINLPFDSPLQKSDGPTFIEPSLLVALVTAFLLGFSDACWQTQIYSIIADLCHKTNDHDTTSLFAIFKFFQSMTACVSFYYGSLLRLHWQLLILAVGCFSSAFAFLRIDFKVRTL